MDEKLVIAVASSAIFDLTEADMVFREKGEKVYRSYSVENENNPFPKGPVFDFIERLLSVNQPHSAEPFEPIEVILLSRNDADTGNRVLKSFQHYGLPVVKAAFTSGRKPYSYIDAFNVSLFLSAHESDVIDAIADNKPAGIIMPSRPGGLRQAKISTDETSGNAMDSHTNNELKIAFDFDGILADDSSEIIFQNQGLEPFQAHEKENSSVPLLPGPLFPLLHKISKIQQKEFEKQIEDPHYKPRIRTAIITARSAPAHERVVKTLRHWGIHIDSSFFLGGMPKEKILSEFRPHIFFDDQVANLNSTNLGSHVSMALVHVPYGIRNKRDKKS